MSSLQDMVLDPRATFRSPAMEAAITPEHHLNLLVARTGSGKTLLPGVVANMNPAVLHIKISPLRVVQRELVGRCTRLMEGWTILPSGQELLCCKSSTFAWDLQAPSS
ncbi:hypothetical protein BJ742DRAFT_745567 [Cladochytrium replicatum]|nr:hypothetical protein BJ742DRAFT_745567 [Cladochytrium replicatum]